MSTYEGKKILLGITGGIAAYKSADLVRRLREVGAEVQVVMTTAAQEFITPLTMQAVSGNPVHTDLLNPAAEAAMGHIELARWADLVVIAPASADFIARLAYGHANDLLSTLCLATTAPITIAPAMNQQMWQNPITQENINRVSARGISILGPAVGSQACGEVGPGRMLEPFEIISAINLLLSPKLFHGEHIVITAGPTREKIDPVRYLTNRSSGKMGFALATAAQAAGARVTLITGPVNLPTPIGVERLDVETAAEMYEAVQEQLKSCAIFIGAAAVSDYRCEEPAAQKIKKNSKNNSTLTLKLIQNVDILASVSAITKHRPYIVGFAAETENLIENAKQKLQTKKLDLIAANLVSEKNIGFDSDNNQLTILSANSQRDLPVTTKKQLAINFITLIAEYYYAKNPS